MRRLFNRAAVIALCVSVALGAAVTPSAADDAAPTKGSQLTKLSPASRQVLATAAPEVRAALAPTPSRRSQAQTPATAGSGPFFKSTRGKITLALMGAGVGFTIWSINHDRKPVKSPVR